MAKTVTASKKKTTVADLALVLQENFKDEITLIPGETSLDTAIRILKAIVAAPPEAPAEPLQAIALHDAGKGETLNVAILPPDKLLVDKRKFYEMFSALVKGYHGRYINKAGMSLIAKVLGAKTTKEEYAEWDKCCKFLIGR